MALCLENRATGAGAGRAFLGARSIVDPVRDLRPVCPNCHVVIHLRHPPRAIEEVRAMLCEQGSAQNDVSSGRVGADGSERRMRGTDVPAASTHRRRS